VAQLAVIVGAVSIYARGLRRIRERAGASRVVTAHNVWCLLTGVVLIEVALLGPVEQLDTTLFSVHMVQHLLLGLLAPLFIVLGKPIIVASWALRPDRRRRVEGFRRKVLPPARFRRSAPWIGAAAVIAHVTSWWLWHIPDAFDAALRHPLVHDAEHLTLFLTGIGLWWVAVGVRWRERAGLAIVELLVASMGTGILSALLVFSNHPLYLVAANVRSYGISPMSDQQLGGGIMWVPGGIIYLTAAVVIFARWLQLGPARSADPERPVPEWPGSTYAPAPASPASSA
jgi:putative membrane protein